MKLTLKIVFWQRTAISIERPKVEYKNKLSAELLFIDQLTGTPKVLEFSTVKTVQQYSQNLLAAPVVRSSFQDLNHDGKPEQWNITLQVRSPDINWYLQSATIIAAFDYQTNDAVHMQMETLAVAHVTVPSSVNVPVKHLKTTGQLKLEQQNSISEGIGYGIDDTQKRTEYNDDFFS